MSELVQQYISQARQWWLGLHPRERLILGWGVGLAVVIMFYALIWQPWHKAIAHMETALQERRQSLVWMQQQSERVRSGEFSVAQTALKGTSQSLLAVIEQTAKRSGVRDSIQQMVPSSDQSQVRVVMEQTAFNDWVRWVDVLFREYGVSVIQLTAEREDDAPNIAEIRVTFGRN
ncbi:MAG: type II secretion system protein M [Gammaproteobacteria bacterium]|nr:type II secretion system protein M [Gammaproteobacteria bacterium]